MKTRWSTDAWCAEAEVRAISQPPGQRQTSDPLDSCNLLPDPLSPSGPTLVTTIVHACLRAKKNQTLYADPEILPGRIFLSTVSAAEA